MSEQSMEDLKRQVREEQARARAVQDGASLAANRARVRLWMSVIVVGIVAFVVGFWPWGSWVSGETYKKDLAAAAQTAQQELAVTVLTQVCVANAQADPDSSLLVTISAAQPSQQISEILKTTWVKFEGVKISTATTRAVAEACQQLLFPPKEAAKTTG